MKSPIPSARASGIALTALVAVCAGCFNQPPPKGKRPPVVPATGVVLFQGKPVADADVVFVNPEANTTATAKTDSSGRFALSTFDPRDGVTIGTHLVGIRRVDVIDKNPPGLDLSAGNVGVPPEIRWIVPESFSVPQSSGLTATVTTKGPSHFPFDLK